MDEDNKRSYITNKDLQLELKALRTEALASEAKAVALVDLLRRDMKVWLIGAVIGNQVLNNFALPSFATTTAAIGGALYLAGKGAIFGLSLIRGG